ncbi:MAG: kelch repeat-containing protein [Chitinophagales bacterium]
MKILFLAISFYLFTGLLQINYVKAQSGQWIWIKGDSSTNQAGVFGTMGVPDSLNTPPALYGPADWKDKQGNFWFFGGTGSTSPLSAMWKYDPSVNQWTWVLGSQSCCAAGVYGTKGVPSVNNYPGARGYGCATWVDSSGNFWLFGGFGTNGMMNDLWRFNPSTYEWTWMKGSDISLQPGVYGTQGVADSANTPGAREETTANWADNQNNLWMYGGIIAPDDLWKYDILNNEWTWVKGSSSGSIAPVYGTKGIPSITNTPGSRYIYAKWKDAQDNFWLFGGYTLAASGARNDLWRYAPASNEWTWMNGPNTGNDGGIYTNYCSPDSLSRPRARFENRAVWTDENGKFWMMGGFLDFLINTVNDMWYYTPSTDEWTWVSGNTNQNYTGFYGTQGISNPFNDPSSRGGAVSWIDDECHLWLFGGWSNSSFARKNDVWKFIPGDSCGACISLVTALNASDTSVCEKFCIDFNDQSTNNPTSWQWIFPGGTPASSNDQNPAGICYATPGIYDVTLITANANGSDTLTLSNYITVNPTPAFPSITQVGYTLTSSFATSYQWQFNSYDIPGATNQSYTVLQSGLYTVVISDSNGCINSVSKEVIITGIDDVADNIPVSIYPNPSAGVFIVELMQEKSGDEVLLHVMNLLGQTVFSSVEKLSTAEWKKEINLSKLESGIYYIEIKTGDAAANTYLLRIKQKILIVK